jgi:hypothetical protein
LAQTLKKGPFLRKNISTVSDSLGGETILDVPASERSVRTLTSIVVLSH